MKNINRLLIIACIIVIAGCHTTKEQADVQDSKKEKVVQPEQSDPAKEMTRTRPKGTYKVSGKITHSSSYCGGAAPDPGMVAEMNMPKPYRGKKLYIKKGDSNANNVKILDSIISDNAGLFELYLAPGKYCILQPGQLQNGLLEMYMKNNHYIVDAQCLEQWQQSCYKTIVVTDSDITDLEFHFHKPCFTPEGVPCINYSGPLPP